MACFGDFAVARLGILAGQTALNITGQNISNINTQGYTRQRLDQYSFVTNNAGFYRSGNSVSAGSGVMLAGVSQLRDPFLDIRFRKEMASVGSAGGLLDGYDSLASIIDDVNKEGITNSLAGLFDAIADLNADHTGEQEFDTLVRKAAEELCTLLNTTAEKLQQELEGKIKEYNENIKDANNILTKIQELNDQIRTADINGDPALELRDQRNLLIDELSEYMKIDVTYSQEDVGSGYTVEKLTIKMVNNETGKPGATLIDGSSRAEITADAEYFLNTSELVDLKGNQVSDTSSYFLLSGLEFGAGATNGPRNVSVTTGDGRTINFDFQVVAPADPNDPDAVAAAREQTLANLRDALNGALGGDFTVSSSATGITIKSNGTGGNAETIESLAFTDANAGVSFTHQKDIPAVASNSDRIEEGEGYGYLESMRQIITGEGSFRMDGGDTSIRGIPYYQKSLDALANKLATEMNRINTTQPDGTAFDPNVADGAGNLFVAEGDDGANPTTTITAANISISQEWQRNEVHIVTTTDPDLSSGNDNLTRFEYLRGQELGFSPIEIARENGTGFRTGNLTQTGAAGQPLQATITYLDSMNQKHTVTIDFTSGADADDTMQALETAINNNQELIDAGLTANQNNGSSLVISGQNGDDDTLCSLVTDINITNPDGSETTDFELGAGGYTLNGQDITGAGSNIYKGALNSFYANMQAVLGSDANTISTIYDTYATSADSINTSRDSVSGVDLNEEGINLLQYQKSFAAACRLMTTLDEMMDKVINGMGIVGR